MVDRVTPWLPPGAHHDLNMEHHPSPPTGPYVAGAGPKITWHVTVSPWMAIDSMIRVLKDKHAEPQLVIGGRPGYKFPVVAQLLALNQWGKALAHPAGTPETNRAGGVQVEVCARPGNIRSQRAEGTHPFGYAGFDMPELELPESIMRAAAKAEHASDEHRAAVLEDIHLCMHEDDALARSFQSGVAAWTDDTYKALANLTLWIENRHRVPRQAARTFQNTKRFTPGGFISARGHLGHMHVPNNTHFDPTTAFKGKHLVRLLKNAPYQL